MHQDKSRVKASHFAKMEGHRDIVDFLSQFKYEAKRTKEEKAAKDSSMNEKKKKKESLRNDYSLAFCNEYGQVV